MIEESYVSFNTAKMLKETGFDIPCRGLYVTDRTGYYEFREYDNKQTKDDLCWNTEDGFQYEYLAPTQALAARWLREVHNIDITVDVYNRDYYCCNVYQNKHLMLIKNIVNENYDEVLKDGLREALRIIIKKKEDE